MTVRADDIILHQYASSPFSEKVRLALGIKGLAWHAVEIPLIMPRPALMPLTGGYRRTPVMQIGADIYCDTQCILRELERRYPEPSLAPPPAAALAQALWPWTDRAFFQASAGILFGMLGPAVPAEFLKDREALTGRPIDVGAMTAAVPHLKEQWRAFAGWLEETLADGRPFLAGDRPSLADVHGYMNVWFVLRAPVDLSGLLAGSPRVRRWADRLAQIGHGRVAPLDANAALGVARDASSTTAEASDAGEPNGLRPGMAVRVTPDDYGQVPVTGGLVASDAQTIALRRSTPETGEVVVHFPRVGFLVQPA